MAEGGRAEKPVGVPDNLGQHGSRLDKVRGGKK
jgi:hypothetical protein